MPIFQIEYYGAIIALAGPNWEDPAAESQFSNWWRSSLAKSKIIISLNGNIKLG